jgi:hypothetical protein
MDIIKTGRKGKHLNASEKYHIRRISKDNLHVNDIQPHIRNIIRALHQLAAHTHPQSRY